MSIWRSASSLSDRRLHDRIRDAYLEGMAILLRRAMLASGFSIRGNIKVPFVSWDTLVSLESSQSALLYRVTLPPTFISKNRLCFHWKCYAKKCNPNRETPAELASRIQFEVWTRHLSRGGNDASEAYRGPPFPRMDERFPEFGS